MTEQPIRLAIVGLGDIGRQHVRRAVVEPACRLVAVADPMPAAELYANDLELTLYTDYRDMLAKERIDGVIVAVPNQLHAEVAIACAEAGVHMLVEKPVAETVALAQQMIDAAHKAGVAFLVGHHRRHNPLVAEARNIVHGGEIGKFLGASLMWAAKKPDAYYDVAWRTQPGAGPLLINLIHDIDNLRYLCGEIADIRAVTANTARGKDVEDSAALLLRFESGAAATVFLTDASPSPWSWEMGSGDNHNITSVGENSAFFFGTEGSLGFPTLELWRYTDPNRVGWNHPLSRISRTPPRGDALGRQITHFCRVIRGKEQPLVSGVEGARTLAATLAVHEAAQSGDIAVPKPVHDPEAG